MVSEPHNGFSAELALAKLLASTGEYDAALDEANEILQRDQINHGALLVKGKTLRRRKAFGDAMRAYRAILERTDDFDARMGLVYCLLAIGHKQEAERQFKLLHAEDEWQQSDLMELARYIDVNVRPVVEYMITNFKDTDKYSGAEQDFTAKGNIADWDVSLSARHRATVGDGILAVADTAIVYVGTNISESFHVFAGLGICELSWQQNASATNQVEPFSVGEFRVDAQIWSGTANFAYTVDALTANAALIQNVVGVKSSEVTYNLPLNTALTVKAKYRSSEYTDGKVANDDNTSQEFEGLTLLALNSGAPQFSVGYSYRYLSYEKSSTQGYFDPQAYEANKLLFLAAYEHGPFYLYSEYVVGRQSYIRKNIKQDDAFDHVGVTTGTTLWKGFRVELSAEQNNSNADNSDYIYGDESISLRLSYSL
jgi:tetratricopeptide (TPR) repeat protein